MNFVFTLNFHSSLQRLEPITAQVTSVYLYFSSNILTSMLTFLSMKYNLYLHYLLKQIRCSKSSHIATLSVTFHDYMLGILHLLLMFQDTLPMPGSQQKHIICVQARKTLAKKHLGFTFGTQTLGSQVKVQGLLDASSTPPASPIGLFQLLTSRQYWKRFNLTLSSSVSSHYTNRCYPSQPAALLTLPGCQSLCKR